VTTQISGSFTVGAFLQSIVVGPVRAYNECSLLRDTNFSKAESSCMSVTVARTAGSSGWEASGGSAKARSLQQSASSAAERICYRDRIGSGLLSGGWYWYLGEMLEALFNHHGQARDAN
jgi:hypothetical protein